MPGCRGRLVPNRIYERTFKNGNARFGEQMRISFGYEALVSAYKLQQTGTNRRGHPRSVLGESVAS
jgi:hypothetical protein